MTFAGWTELEETSWNADHTSAIMYRVETDSRSPLDHSRRWVAAKEGLWLENSYNKVQLSR